MRLNARSFEGSVLRLYDEARRKIGTLVVDGMEACESPGGGTRVDLAEVDYSGCWMRCLFRGGSGPAICSGRVDVVEFQFVDGFRVNGPVGAVGGVAGDKILLDRLDFEAGADLSGLGVWLDARPVQGGGVSRLLDGMPQPKVRGMATVIGDP